MTVQEIINLARFYAHINEGQLSDDDALIIFNQVYKQIGRDIMTYVDENYFYERWTRDAIANQPNGEYLYPEADHNSAGAVKIINVEIKPYPDSEYIRCTEVKEGDLTRSWEWYLENQQNLQPVFFIADKSIFIAPQFKPENVQVGANQIRLIGYKKFVDLAKTDTADKILIDDDFHDIIALGMVAKILFSRGMLNEAEVAQRIFDGGGIRDFKELPKGALGNMLIKMSNRRMNNLVLPLPNETKLQYGS